MDRLSPCIRPEGPNSGTQRWEELAFFHWEIPVAVARKLVPSQLDLDLWNGQAFVGVVPFLMRSIRPRLWPHSWGFNFHETNVRLYVSYNGKPGVYFLSLDASSRLAVTAARIGWSLPYFHARMNHSVANTQSNSHTENK